MQSLPSSVQSTTRAGCTLQQRCILIRRSSISGKPRVRMPVVHAAASSAAAVADRPDATITGVMNSVVTADGKKAYWLAPQGKLENAKGVVLFMHGFSQSPLAYYRILQDVANQGLLVVAPAPPNASKAAELQGYMTEYAGYFRDLVYNNQFPFPDQQKLSSSAICQNIGLFGHSVGAGLETYVASTAAQDSQPFKSVMYMAPQTQVVSAYKPASALAVWPASEQASTQFAVQYGLADLLAPFPLALQLMKELKEGQFKEDPSTCYWLGTHIGFEDQLMLGDKEVDQDILPYVNFILTLLSLAIAAGIKFDKGRIKLVQQIVQLLFKDRLKTAEHSWFKKVKQDLEKDAQALLGSTATGGGVQADGIEKGLSPREAALLLLQLAVPTKESPSPSTDVISAAAPTDCPVFAQEKVTILPASKMEEAYTKFLLSMTLVFLASTFASHATEGSLCHWFWAPVSFLTGLFSVCGGYSVAISFYENGVQRPDSRAKASAFFKRTLLKA